MKHIIRIVMFTAVLPLCISSSPVPVLAVGNQLKHVLISEVSTETNDSAGNEYIELYNPNETAVDVSGWRLQYRSANHPNSDTSGWTIRAILGCASAKASECATPDTIKIDPGEGLHLSSFEANEGILPLVSGMATAGGQVRLTDASGSVQDFVGYGTASGYERSVAIAPQAGRSIVRKQDEQQVFIDTDDNGADFFLTADSKEGTGSSPTDGSAPTTSETDPGKGAGTTYLDVEITEVMPDPASPQLDSADEFIELYNPYDQALDLDGYVLKAGSTWSYKYTIEDVTLAPHDYIAFMSSQTHLSLSNSGSGVRAYDPNGKLLYEVPSYGKAKTGNSWVRNAAGGWVWTTKPTPGEQNVIDQPLAAAATKGSTVGSKSSKSAAKTASAKKASTPKSTSTSKGGSSAAQQLAQASPESTTNSSYLILLGIGALAAGYAVYEYRQEIAGFFRRGWSALTGIGKK